MKIYDCETCVWRGQCPNCEPNHFCIRWRGENPQSDRTDPNPGGWTPETEDG